MTGWLAVDPVAAPARARSPCLRAAPARAPAQPPQGQHSWLGGQERELEPGGPGARPPVVAGAAGFTLIELLVAITLLGLLMAAIFGSLRLGTRAWETGAARLEHSARLQVVQDFLRQRLSAVLPLRDRLPGDRPAFEGGPEALRFITALPTHLGGGLHEFVLTVAESESEPGFDLIVQWRRLVPADEPYQPPWQQRRLLAGIDGLSLAYWGSEQLDLPADWHAEWAGELDPPQLVRVAVAFAEDDSRHFPVLIARRMIDRTDGPAF